jgi:hypothetical protein
MRRTLLASLFALAALALLFWACLLATEGRPPGPRWTHPLRISGDGRPGPMPTDEPPLVTDGADEGRVEHAR